MLASLNGLIQVNDGGSRGHQSGHMSERHSCCALPTIRWPAGRARVCSALLRLGALLVALAVAVNFAHASSPSHLGQVAPASVAAAPTPADDPCGSGPCCTQDCALACTSGASAIAAQAIVPLVLGCAGGITPIARSDVKLGSGGPLPPFHPPKLPALA